MWANTKSAPAPSHFVGIEMSTPIPPSLALLLLALFVIINFSIYVNIVLCSNSRCYFALRARFAFRTSHSLDVSLTCSYHCRWPFSRIIFASRGTSKMQTFRNQTNIAPSILSWQRFDSDMLFSTLKLKCSLKITNTKVCLSFILIVQCPWHVKSRHSMASHSIESWHIVRGTVLRQGL